MNPLASPLSTMKACSDDIRFMKMALACAAKGVGQTRPNPPVGAVVVDKDGNFLGKGYHHKAGGPHAEVNAITACGDTDLSGATLYVTLEPCSTTGRTPPCCDLIIRRHLKRVVIGCADPNPKHAGRGIDILRNAGVQVDFPLCQKLCEELIAPFASRMTRGRPHLTLKLAATLDGRIADRTGSSKWITGPAARTIVQRMRKTADAILVGSETALLDDPQLRCRLRGAAANAFRVVIDSRGRLPSGLRLLSDPYASQTIVATTPRGALALQKVLPKASSVRLWTFSPNAEGHVPLLPLLERLSEETDVMEVLCEGGGKLAGALMKEGLVDRLALFYAPLILGDNKARPVFDAIGALLPDALRLELESIRKIGPDFLTIFTRIKTKSVVQ